MRITLSFTTSISAFVACALILGGCAKVTSNPTGIWEWSEKLGSDNTSSKTFKYTLELKQVDGNLTGTVSANDDQKFPVENVQCTGQKLSFDTGTRLFGRQTFNGTVSGNIIRGQMTSEYKGKTSTKEWVATRKGF